MTKVRADLHNYFSTNSDVSGVSLNGIRCAAEKNMGSGPKIIGICNYGDDRVEQILDGARKRSEDFFQGRKYEGMKEFSNAVYLPGDHYGDEVLFVKGERVVAREGIPFLLLGVDFDEHPEQGRDRYSVTSEAKKKRWTTVAIQPHHPNGVGDYIMEKFGVIGKDHRKLSMREAKTRFELDMKRLKLGADHPTVRDLEDSLSSLMESRIRAERVYLDIKQNIPGFLRSVDAYVIYGAESSRNPWFSLTTPNAVALGAYKKLSRAFPHLGALADSGGFSPSETGSSFTVLDVKTPLGELKTGDDIRASLNESVIAAKIDDCFRRPSMKSDVISVLLCKFRFSLGK